MHSSAKFEIHETEDNIIGIFGMINLRRVQFSLALYTLRPLRYITVVIL